MPEISEFSAPDWNAIAHDVLCPLCEYNLRGLSEARCPECGYRFEWAVITDLDLSTAIAGAPGLHDLVADLAVDDAFISIGISDFGAAGED